MVVVRSDIARVDAVLLRVDGMGDPKLAVAEDLDEHPLPRTVAIVHEGGTLGPITITAEGMVSDERLVSRRAEVSFVRGRNLMLVLDLEASCIGMRCGESDDTCVAGACESAEVASHDLPRWTGNPPKGLEPADTDAGSNLDAGLSLDSSGAGEVDAAEPMRDAEMPASDAGGETPCDACAFDPETSEPHATLACEEGSCTLTCDVDYVDADLARGNGCEAHDDAFAWTPSNAAAEADVMASAIMPSLVVDCSEELDFGSGALPSNPTLCGRSISPVAIAQRDGGSEIVVLAARSLDVKAGSKLRLKGTRPVAIFVYGDASVAGEIDISSRGTNAPAGSGFDCGASAGGDGAVGPLDNFGGRYPSGGGGGGGFGSRGGAGGTTSRNIMGGAAGVAWSSGQLTPLRGGCPGGKGGKSYGANAAGGSGGGALQLSVSGTLFIAGTLAAAGGGGQPAAGGGDGGGGGGSGGGILLEATRVELAASGWLTANGGGGGGGFNWNYPTGSPTAGGDGAHASFSSADGGAGLAVGADGGSSDNTLVDAGNAVSEYGGGGAGGAVGKIVVRAAECALGGSASPSVACADLPN